MTRLWGLVFWWAAAAVTIAIATLDSVPAGILFAGLGGIVLGALSVDGALLRLLRLARIELAKLAMSRVFQLGLVAAALVTLAAGLLHEPFKGETGWAIAAGSMGAGFWAAEVFLLVLGATTIAGELGQGTLKMILPHAYRRSEWIAAKALALIVAAVVFGCLVLGVSLGHAAATNDLGDIVKEIPPGFGDEESSLEVFQSAAVMQSHLSDFVLASIASLIATALIGVVVSTMFDSVVPALSAAFLLFLGLQSADVLLGLPRDVLQHVYASYPSQLGEWTVKLGRGLNETWDDAYLGTGLRLSLVATAIAWLLAIARFDRRDLHS